MQCDDMFSIIKSSIQQSDGKPRSVLGSIDNLRSDDHRAQYINTNYMSSNSAEKSISDIDLTNFHDTMKKTMFNSFNDSKNILTISQIWSTFLSNDLSLSNHRINSMGMKDLKECINDHYLNPFGSKMILKRRLLEFVRRIKNLASLELGIDYSTANLFAFPDIPILLKPDQFYSHLLIIDFEATCVEIDKLSEPNNYPHEIIEFPILIYNTLTGQCEGVFHSYCKPTINPKLSNFCKQLTKLNQDDIDQAPCFPEVLKKIDKWLFEVHKLKQTRFAVLCDCNADMGKFMRIQCKLSNLSIPRWARVWINLSKSFRSFYKIPSKERVSLDSMLKQFDLSFVGQKHCGLYDALNILRIVNVILSDGCQLRVNERIDLGNPPRFVCSVTKLMAETTLASMSSKLPCSSSSSSPNKNKSKTHSPNSKFQRTTEQLSPVDVDLLLRLADLQKTRVSSSFH